MSGYIWLALYLLVSIATYVGLLRQWFRDFGPEWYGVIWSLAGFVPISGQIVWLINADHPKAHLDAPRWLRRLGGVK